MVVCDEGGNGLCGVRLREQTWKCSKLLLPACSGPSTLEKRGATVCTISAAFDWLLPWDWYFRRFGVLVPNFRALNWFKARGRAGDNTLFFNSPQQHFTKGKAINQNSVEVKIVRTRAETPSEDFSYWIITFYDRITTLTCDVELSTIQMVTDWFQHPPWLRWSLI